MQQFIIRNCGRGFKNVNSHHMASSSFKKQASKRTSHTNTTNKHKCDETCYEIHNEVNIFLLLFSHCVIHQMATHISGSNFYQLSGWLEKQTDAWKNRKTCLRKGKSIIFLNGLDGGLKIDGGSNG